MSSYKIVLSSVEDVRRFVADIGKADCEVDLVSGRYTVDAKSIMGIFSLDLSKPIVLEAHDGGKGSVAGIVKPYLADGQ